MKTIDVRAYTQWTNKCVYGGLTREKFEKVVRKWILGKGIPGLNPSNYTMGVHRNAPFSFSFFLICLFIYLFIYYMKVHCSCLQTLQKRESDLVTDGCEPPCGCWELNSGPLEEQSVLLTTEPSLQFPETLFSQPSVTRSDSLFWSVWRQLQCTYI